MLLLLNTFLKWKYSKVFWTIYSDLQTLFQVTLNTLKTQSGIIHTLNHLMEAKWFQKRTKVCVEYASTGSVWTRRSLSDTFLLQGKKATNIQNWVFMQRKYVNLTHTLEVNAYYACYCKYVLTLDAWGKHLAFCLWL